MEAPFGPKFSEIHPTNSQFVPLLIMDFEYIKSLPPIHYSPFRPKVGIMTHLVVSDLLIYPFNFKELTHTSRDLRSYLKRVPFISLVCSTIYVVFTLF